MSFDAPKMMLVGLVKITLPSDTIRLCDGGFIYFDAEKYTSADADFGAIESVENIADSMGDEAPGGSLVFLPSSTAAAATLSNPDYQGSSIKVWLARVDEATGTVSDTEQVADFLLDRTELRLSRGSRRLKIDFTSAADRLFNLNEGNVLSSTFHESVWPGENGFKNAIGAAVTVAWGIAGPPRGSVGVSGGGSSTRSTTNRFMQKLF